MKINKIVATLLLFSINAIAQQPPKGTDISRRHYPIMQSSTGDKEVYFNALLPRLKEFSIRAKLKNPKDRRQNPVISGEVVGRPQQDPDGLLHEKVMSFKISGLQPDSEYILELIEKGSGTVDYREFKTLGTENKPTKFATVSCMCDEVRYENERQILWKKVVEQNPDIVLLIGDETYVDSFDYVVRNKATSFDVWTRYFRSYSENLLFRSYKLIPVAATWDDHDTGVDNGNKNTPTLAEASRAFKALYGAFNIPGFVNTHATSLAQAIKVNGQNFIVLDNRTFRETHEVNDRFAHFGEDQEKWLIEKMKTEKGPFFLFNGDMWGSPTVTSTAYGKVKRVTESVFGDHPLQYEGMMKAMNDTGKVYVLFSGDIHASQIIEHGPQFQGPRNNPFTTLEITSSPMHSFIFQPKPGEEVIWPDAQRILGVKDYNFVMTKSRALEGEAVDIEATAIGMKDDPLFQLGTTILRNGKLATQRRQILNDNFSKTNGRVKVAFFDADSTLRLAPSKNVSANGPTDVAILPGVADKIAELNEQGFLVAIVSNQGGVKEGYVKFEVADQALRYTMQLIQEENPKAKFHYYDMAERGHGDYFTKPNVGMGKYLEFVLRSQNLEIDWQSSFMVGDSRYKKSQVTPQDRAGADFSDTDRLFGFNLDLRTFDPKEFFKWSEFDYKLINHGDIPRSCKGLF